MTSFQAKNEVWYFLKNSCTRVYENWPKMKFIIFSKIHVPGAMKIGQKWILIFFWKFLYPGLHKLAKNEVCDFFKNSCTQVYENWQKMKFDIFLKIAKIKDCYFFKNIKIHFEPIFVDPCMWIFKKITDLNFSHFL